MDGKVYDFAVIGAGMAGASIAAEIAPYASVVVLEAEDAPGYHSTGRSAAFWEECYGGPGIVPLTLPSGAFLRANGFLRGRGALYVTCAPYMSGAQVTRTRWTPLSTVLTTRASALSGSIAVALPSECRTRAKNGAMRSGSRPAPISTWRGCTSITSKV
jgi:choline dehydrogenase-like flavoprotein